MTVIAQATIGWLPIIACAVLNRAGGQYDKRWRRLGIGIFLAIWGLIHSVDWALCLAVIPVNFVVTSLPITLKGDDITKYWFNWVWLYALGILWGLIPTVLHIQMFWYCLPFSLLFGTLIVLSNVKKTAEIFRWAYVELAIGTLLGLETYMLLISL